MRRFKKFLILCFLLFALCVDLFAQVSRTDGVDVFYYDSLHEAVSAVADNAAAVGASFEQPDEITLLADMVLDKLLTVDDGKHIRLVAGGSARTIRRSVNLIEFPVIWVRGEGASLSLGKPGMEYELVIDGGYLNSPPIEAHAPLIVVSGSDSKLVMYDNVTIQNNKNIGDALAANNHLNGAGVYIFTQGDITRGQAEFIMKGGIIKGNINDTHNPYRCGGGVMIQNSGIFTMEGGAIMNNTADHSGGGFYTDTSGSFKKTGGIIYGSNAPAAYRNTALTGTGTPRNYGHAVAVAAAVEALTGYRNDTVKENDNLTFNVRGSALFGKGEKWDTRKKASMRVLLTIILPFTVIVVGVFLILRKRYLKKLAGIVQEAANTAAKTVPYIDLGNTGLTDHEKDLCELLLTDRPLKEIALILELGYSGAHKKAQKLYAKLGIRNRTELLVRVKSEK
jgi:predicted outer membrane repeat protein